jgi:hypothetical protein
MEREMARPATVGPLGAAELFIWFPYAQKHAVN